MVCPLGGDDSPLTDVIIDRIAHDSYRINITSFIKSTMSLDGCWRLCTQMELKRQFSGIWKTTVSDEYQNYYREMYENR